MLSLARHPGERILIGPNIVVEVDSVKGDRVNLRISAPAEISILRAEIIGKGPSTLEERKNWPLLNKACSLQPIETAPKDGRYILLFGPSGYTGTPLRCAVGRYYPSYRPLNPWQTHSNDAFTDGGSDPTHWMELPKTGE